MAKTASRSQRHGPNDGWVFFGLLALLIWAPLPLGSNRLWAIGLLQVAACALVLGTLWVWREHLPAAMEQLHKFRWPAGLLTCMVLISWLQITPLPVEWLHLLSPKVGEMLQPTVAETVSIDVFQSQSMAALSSCYLAIFLVAVMTVRESARLDRLAQVLVFSGVMQAVLGAVLFSLKAEYRLFYSNVSHTRMIGSFVSPNNMAGYLCMCLSIGIGLMLARLGRGEERTAKHWKTHVVGAIAFMLSPKMRLRLLLIVMVIGLVLTRSRMGNAALFISMVAVGLIAVIKARQTAPQTIALIVSLIVIDVLVVGTWVGLEKVVERIQQTELTVADGGKSESVEARTEAARTSLPIVSDFPILGTGGGTFYNIFLSYRTPSYGYTYVDHTHNDFVEIATDYGLVGLGILGVLVASTLVTVVQVMGRRKSRLPWGIAFGVAMSIVALLFHSTVDFNLQIPSNALTMVVILAMGWIASVLPSPKGGQKSTRSASQ
jgi:O-antigen ligase